MLNLIEAVRSKPRINRLEIAKRFGLEILPSPGA